MASKTSPASLKKARALLECPCLVDNSFSKWHQELVETLTPILGNTESLGLENMTLKQESMALRDDLSKLRQRLDEQRQRVECDRLMAELKQQYHQYNWDLPDVQSGVTLERAVHAYMATHGVASPQEAYKALCADKNFLAQQQRMMKENLHQFCWSSENKVHEMVCDWAYNAKRAERLNGALRDTLEAEMILRRRQWREKLRDWWRGRTFEQVLEEVRDRGERSQ